MSTQTLLKGRILEDGTSYVIIPRDSSTPVVTTVPSTDRTRKFGTDATNRPEVLHRKSLSSINIIKKNTSNTVGRLKQQIREPTPPAALPSAESLIDKEVRKKPVVAEEVLAKRRREAYAWLKGEKREVTIDDETLSLCQK